ncbi:MAG: protein-disulfide reductase DsbD [Methylobacillus sp.]|jgi:thiol:disulfide interchange protein DsbD|nr:protein-disulfide reductase DsbD [Methylobacillus sp.]
MSRFLILVFCFLAACAHAQTGLLADDDAARILEPNKAFHLQVEAVDAQTIIAHFTIAPGYYLYRERISFKLDGADDSVIAAIELPPGEIKQDPNFGEMLVFHESFDGRILLKHTGAAPQEITLLASYQGCSERGLCYAPIEKTLSVELPGADGTATGGSETDRVVKLLRGGKWWLIVASFFGFGLLLALTPCMYPMYPILSGIIVGQQHPTRLHAFNLALAYVLGMALSYTVIGIAAAFSGHLISNALQTPWALGFGALIFVVLAFSMFGFYDLRLPSAVETRLARASNHLKGGRFVGVFAIGVLSALIMSPCVAAPLAGALLYIGQTRDVVLGGMALFTLAIGMGVPLLILGASAGAILPRSGPWMKLARNFFGVVMLGMAAWLIAPVVTNLLAPTAAGTHQSVLPFKTIKNLAELKSSLQQAQGKFVMLDFYADWCVECKRFEQTTFRDPRVQKMLENAVLLQADVTQNNDDDIVLQKYFGLYGPPGIIFFDAQGREIKAAGVVGYQNAEEFLITLNRVYSSWEGECAPVSAC